MKTNIYYLFFLITGAIFGGLVLKTYEAHTANYHMSTVDPLEKETVVEYVYIESEPEIEYVYIPDEEPFYRNFTEEECSLLEQIAFAEAKGEGIKGMMLVMNVVINRSEEWNMSIRDVIYADGQFYVEGMTPDVSEECHEAMAFVLEGIDESQGALFFNKYGYRNGKEPLFQYKNHYFSK